ncbi:MAG: Ig-like domain-containing protein, partial [Cyclobacteriaceae bacterium]
DGASPIAVAVFSVDNDGDGNADGLEIEYSEPMSDASFTAAALADWEVSIDGFTSLDSISSFDTQTDIVSSGTVNVANDEYVTLSFAPVDVTGTATVNYRYAYGAIANVTDGTNNLADISSTAAVDKANPVLISSTPTAGSSSADGSANIVLNFSEDIKLGTTGATKTLTINHISGANGSGFPEVYDLTSASETTISSNNITLIRGGAALPLLNEFAIQLSADAIDDLATSENSFAGILDNTTLAFTVNDINPTNCSFNWATATGNKDNVAVSPSDCIENTPVDSISSLVTSKGLAVPVFYFALSDTKNGSTFSSITIANGNTDIDWTKVFADAILIDENGSEINSTNQTVNITSSTIEFSNIPTTGGGFGVLGTEEVRDISLRVWLRTDLDVEGLDIDNRYLVFEMFRDNVDNADRVWDVDNNTFANSSSIFFTDSVAFDVDATNYTFLQQPSTTDANVVMTPAVTLEATDANGNRDLDYDGADAVTITSSGTLSTAYSTPTISSNWVDGVGTVSNIVHSAPAGSFTLGTTGGALTDAAASTSFTINGETQAPSIINITRQNPTNATVNNTTVTFRVAFDEAVSNVDVTDFELAAGGATGAVNSVSVVNASTYDVEVTTVAEGGNNVLNLNIAAGNDIQDAFANAFGAAGTVNAEENYTIDQTGVTLVITRNAVTNGAFTGTNDNSVSFDLAFSEVIDNSTFTVADITVNNGGANFTALTASELVNDGDNQNYTLTVLGITGDGDLTITVGPAIAESIGNDMASAEGPSAAFTIDNTAPSPFTVGTVTPVGAPVVTGYWNEDNTDIQIVVPISADATLTGGTVQIQAQVASEGFFNLGSASTITAGEITANTKTVSVDAATFEALSGNLAEGEVLTFTAIMSDNTGNQTTGSNSTQTITSDQTDPVAFNTGTSTVTGGTLVANFWNTTSTGIDVVIPVENEASLEGGTIQIEANVAGGGFEVLGGAYTIVNADLLAGTKTLSFNETTFEQLSGNLTEDETIVIRAVITDIAGNVTNGGNSGNQIVYDGTAPSAFTTGAVSAVGAPIVTGYWNEDNTDISVVVPIATDASLENGTVQVRAQVGADSFEDLGSPSTITAGEITANSKTVTVTGALFEALSSNLADGEVLTFTAIITDESGNPTTGSNSTQTITIDQTDPDALTVGTVTTVGAPVVTGYWNEDNTSLNIIVPIATDVTLTGGAVQLRAQVGAGTFEDLITPSLITGGEVGANSKTISVLATDFEGITGFTNGAVITIGAIVNDVAGNTTTATVSSQTITVDQLDPSDFTTGTATATGGAVVSSYWNATNTGLNVTTPIENDATLTGGTIQVQANVEGEGYFDLGAAYTITGTDLTNGTYTHSFTAAQFEALSGGLQEAETVVLRSIITDIAGNVKIGTQSANTFIFDEVIPTVTNVTSSTANGVFKVSDVISIQVVFNETVITSGTPQITLETGSSDAPVDYVSGDGTNTFNFTYTVRLNDDNSDLDYVATNSFTGSITDLAGNTAVLTLPTPGAANSLGANKALNVDGLIPVVSASNISYTSSPSGAGSTYKVGDVVTVQWDNTASGDNNLDIDNGVNMDFSEFGATSLVAATETSPSSEVWEASYTITTSTDGSTNIIDVTDAHVFVTATDDAGNVNSGGSTEDEQDIIVDNYIPVVAAGEISITSSPSGDNTTFQVGDIVTAQWDNSALTAPNQDISSVNIDFTEFGATTLVAASNSSNVWTASYTITTSTDGSTNTVDAATLNVFVTATDDASNANAPTEGTDDESVDNEFPLLTVGNLNISDGGGANGVNEYIIGDVVTATWSNLNGGDNIADVASVSFDFTQFGGGTESGSTSDGGDTYTASYTIVDNAVNLNYVTMQDVILTVVDNASNTTILEDDENNTVDNVAPAAPTIPNLQAASDDGIDPSTGAALDSDNKTSNTGPIFDGSGGEALQKVEIYSNTSDGLIGQGNADNSGNWIVGTSITQLDQTHNITAIAYDLSGNPSAASAPLSSPNPFEHISAPEFVSAEWRDGDADGDIDELFITFDQNVVIKDNSATGFESITITGITFNNSTDHDLSSSLSHTLDLTPITGTSNPNQNINYTTSSGSWIVSANGGIEMINADFVLPIDKAAPVVINSITIDTDLDGDVDRVEIQLSEPIIDSHVNTDKGDFSFTPPSGFGTADVGGTFDTEVTEIAADADANDAYFSLEFTPSNSSGTGIFTAQYSGTTIVDGNSNVLSIPAATTLNDGAAPRVKDFANDLSPADNNGAVPATNSLTIKYSEAVTGVGGKNVNIVQQTPIEVTALAANNLGTSGASSTTGQYTLNLGYTTPSATDYYVLIDDGAFKDAANNASANQFSTTTDWNFTTETSLVATSAVLTNSTTITLSTNLVIAIGANTATDFTVSDGIGTGFVVSAIGVSGNEITLTVADMSSAVGDLSVDFDGTGTGGSGNTDINASGNTLKLQDFTGLALNNDIVNPTIASAVYDANSITLTYSEPVQNLGAVAGDFSVTDGALNTYTVQSITDATANDTDLTLNFTGGSLTPVGDLSISYAKNGGNDGIGDFGGNTAQSETESIEIDSDAPTIVAASITANTTIQLEFNESVKITTPSPATDFTVTDGKGNVYVVSAISDGTANDVYINLTLQTVANALGDLTVAYNPAGGTSIQDFGSNSLATFNESIDRDNTQPTLAVTRNAVTNGGSFITNDNSVSYTLVFSEEIDPSTFSATDDIVVTETGVTSSSLVDGDLTTSDNRSYTLTIRDVALDGDISISVDLTDITDYGSNLVSAVTYDGVGTDAGFTIDNTVPATNSVSIASNNAASSASAVIGDDITLTFTTDDALLSTPTVSFRSGGGLVNNAITITNTSGNTYTATYQVANLDNSGAVTFTINFTDDAGNDATQVVSTSDGTSMSVDSQDPTISSIELIDPINGSPTATKDDSAIYVITFSEPVVDFDDVDDINITLGGTIVVGTRILTDSVGSRIWKLAFKDVTGDGTLSFSVIKTGGTVITDQAGNILTAGQTSPTVSFDNTAPTVTITNNTLSSGSTLGTTDNSISYSIVFSTPIDNSTFSKTDLLLTKSGTADTASASLTPVGDNQNYTYSITGITGDGDLGLSIAAGSLFDAANNGLAATVSASTITIDNILPTVTTFVKNEVPAANGTKDGVTNSDSVSFELVFSEPIVDSEFTLDDLIILESGGTSTRTEIVNSGDDQNYRIDLLGVSGDGNIGLRLTVGSVEDPSGNTLASNVASPTFTIDNTLPTVTITRNAVTNGSFTSTNDNSVSFDIAFSTVIDPATFVLGDITVSDASGAVTYTNLVAGDLANDGDNQNYTLTISSIAGDGDLGITIANASVDDLAGNSLNGAVTSGVFAIDNTLPTVSIALEAPANGTIGGTNDNSLIFNLTFDGDLNGSTFTSDDVTVNTTGDVASTTKTVSGVSPNFVVTIGGVTGDGTLGITLGETGIQDNAVNNLSTASSANVSSLFTVDNTQPTVVLTRNAVTNGSFSGSNDDAISFDVAFSEPIVDGSFVVDD